MSDNVVIVQICADTFTALVLATIALLGRWIIFREAVALKKLMKDSHDISIEKMDAMMAEIAELKKQREKP